MAEGNYWQGENQDEPVEEYMPTPDDENTELDQQEPVQDSAENVDEEPIHWQAAEYINQEKNGLWFIGLGVVAAAFIALDILVLKSYTFSVLVAVMVAAIIVFVKRPPKMVNYTLSPNQGLFIGEKLHHFNEFKAFGLLEEHGQNSLMLIPLKRFMPGVSVYFPAEVGEQVVDVLGARLPMKPLKLDIVDIIVQKLRL